MGALDWAIIAAFVPVVVFLAYKKPTPADRAVDRFVGGRKMSWILLGGSLAATSLSTDTPILIAGAFYGDGLAGNWFWLASVPGTMATLFFFARYWRRSGVLTKVEIFAARYGSGESTRWLRAATAVFDGGLVNILVLAAVTYGCNLVIENIFGISNEPLFELGPLKFSYASLLTAAMTCLTAVYTLTGGFKGVVRTDLLQLCVAVLASAFLAAIAIRSGMATFGSYEGLVRALPEPAKAFDLFNTDDVSIALLLMFGWWQSATGSGIFVQRLVSAKSESEATLTAFAFAIIHYVIRVWPWYAIGAIALIYFPTLSENELAFPMVAEKFLPQGGLGLMVIGLISAFMSTVDSRLNWGASYMVNDVVGPFSKKFDYRDSRRTEIAAIAVTTICVLMITFCDVMTSILSIYKYLMLLQAGYAFAAIARWYWWRMTIWAEFAAFASSLVLGNLLAILIDLDSGNGFAIAMALNSVICGALTLITAVWTSRSGPSVPCREFSQRVSVGGPGWFKDGAPLLLSSARTPFGKTVLHWLASVIMIYAAIVLIGALAVLNWWTAGGSAIVMGAAFFWLWLHRTDLNSVLN
jgi:solute:Na+ symporter, SSS family